ncbi:hypothetical protein BGW38_005682 [Lunasporangiospora selenospora]|uniref:Uncharacterized protein n=1 Tax=Lunasporangiospora selenospora TaxID=979761 RepID=A0A9P6FMN8_9FUNG|nr:hypothetical protein BGW38_005682 [Lunasporangiospora selenospora]
MTDTDYATLFVGGNQDTPVTSTIHSPTSTLHSPHSPLQSATSKLSRPGMPSRDSIASSSYSTGMANSVSSQPDFDDGHDMQPTRWRLFRLSVMRMATVERLQLFWALLTIFGMAAWIALMPAYAFRNKVNSPTFGAPAYTFSTIAISVILTILNFFSWIVLAADKEGGAKTDCQTGPLAKEPGYTAQCQAVNVAIVLDVIVFVLWVPITIVIVCGTIERGLWWWGEDDGWAQSMTAVGGSNMMSEEEFDRKIGMGDSKVIKRRQTMHPDNQRMTMVGDAMIHKPKPAFVTPIASQFRRSSAMADNDGADDGDDDFGNFTASNYRRHHQQRQQRKTRHVSSASTLQSPTEDGGRSLTRRASNTSLSSRLSTFFGSGWGSGAMPPDEQAQPPMPAIPAHYLQGNGQTTKSNAGLTVSSPTSPKKEGSKGALAKDKTNTKQEVEEDGDKDSADPAMLHGDSYTTQWHSRRNDDWS